MAEATARNQQDRLQFIEDMLFWHGQVANADLRDRFLVSKAQAANDLARYRDAQPTYVPYEPKLKAFLAPESFAPLYESQGVGRLLSLIQDGSLDVVDFARLQPPPRPVAIELLRPVTQALWKRLDIEVEYTSFSSGLTRRWLSPHALAYDGARVHLRAFDHSRGRFADFVLGRLSQILGRKPLTVDGSSDQDWFEFVTIELVPNPRLAEDRRKAVMAEYDFRGDILSYQVRKAMLIYVNARLLLHSELANMPNAEFYRPLVPRDQPAFDALFEQVTRRMRAP